MMVFMFFVLFIICCVSLYLYSTWTYDYWKKRGVPYEKPIPLFGNFFGILILKRSLQEMGYDLYRAGTGHPIIGFFHFRTPGLMIRDPEVVKAILSTNFDCFDKTLAKVNGKLDPLLVRNPFMLNGNSWRAVKSLLIPAFTYNKVKNQFALMTSECREMIKYLEREAPKNRPDGISCLELAKKFCVDVVVRCGFGILGNSFSESEGVLRELGEDLTKMGMWKAMQIMLYMLVPRTSAFLNTGFIDKRGQHFFRQLIKELIQYREENRVFRRDFLQMLIHIKYMGKTVNEKNMIRVDDLNIEFSDDDIATHALLYFLTGTETSSFVLAFALYELALNPEVQAQLRTEIESVLQKHNGGFTFEAVLEMKYLDMVLNETLRKYPSFPSAPRECTRSCYLSLPGGRNLFIEKGTSTVIPILPLHMDPKYFPEPEKFDPGRFSDERKTSIKAFTFLPFGAGPRQCIAQEFGRAIVKAGLVAIVSHFEIQTTPRTPVEIKKYNFGFVMKVDDRVRLDFIRRK